MVGNAEMGVVSTVAALSRWPEPAATAYRWQKRRLGDIAPKEVTPAGVIWVPVSGFWVGLVRMTDGSYERLEVWACAGGYRYSVVNVYAYTASQGEAFETLDAAQGAALQYMHQLCDTGTLDHLAERHGWIRAPVLYRNPRPTPPPFGVERAVWVCLTCGREERGVPGSPDRLCAWAAGMAHTYNTMRELWAENPDGGTWDRATALAAWQSLGLIDGE